MAAPARDVLHGTEALKPFSTEPAPLFNPRTQDWRAHFEIAVDFTFRGLTPTGRATLHLLQMNRALIVAIRREEAFQGRFP